MAKFHVNPETGNAGQCSAQTPEGCPFKGEDGKPLPHYKTEKEAQDAYAEAMSAVTPIKAYSKRKPASKRPVSTNTFTPPARNFPPELKELDDKLEEASYEEILDYASESPEAHAQVDALINARAAYAEQNFNKLQTVAPKPKTERSLTATNYKAMMTEHNNYRNHTAFLVEAHLASPHYVSKVGKLEDESRLGTAVAVTTYTHDDVRWHSTRFNTIGGSDVGALAIKDFDPAPKGLDAYTVKRVENSKIYPMDEDSAKAHAAVFTDSATRRGALYRGTVWEGRIRDNFADDHPEYTVYAPEGQYAMEGNDWCRVNFDAVLSDREDGEPNGILEIKTGGEPDTWKNGVPLKYRAQTLYYLNATGYDYAYVRVVLNDNETRDYKLSSSDEVAPGCGQTMKQYEGRIREWFEELKSQREIPEAS